jgi:hypothetical protein
VAGPVRYVSTDDTDGDQLYNREIQDSLEALLQGTKLDLIGFDACLMAMVETGYALRNVANVMVGSEELEPGAGWNYTTWLRELVDDPTMDAAALGSVLVESYRRHYEGRDPTVTLSAVDLSQMDTLAASIDALAGAMIDDLRGEINAIRQARQECLVYAPGYGLHGIDLGYFCARLRAATQNATLQARADEVRNQIASCVISNYAGPERQEFFGSEGLAIYFPATRSLFNTDPDHNGYLESNTFFPVEFVQTHQWDNFLQAYYDLVP